MSIIILLSHFIFRNVFTFNNCIFWNYLLLQGTPVKITIGSHVWVEDPALVWIDGQVLQITGQDAEIQTSNEKTVNSAQ